MNIFFDNWESIVRTFTITILAYLAMVLLLRISGKRTLSKMNAFDFIVTIALGSSFASVALNKNVALADGVLVFALLVGLQYLLTWLSVRFHAVKRLITNEPTLLWYKGAEVKHALRKERVTLEELHMVARSQGLLSLEDVDIIILETTGDITIIPSVHQEKISTLCDVEQINSTTHEK